MVILMTILFILGYVFISLEHSIKVNKAAIALVMSVLLWTLYVFGAPGIVPHIDSTWFKCFLRDNGGLANLDKAEQAVRFVIDFQLLEHVGDVSEIVFFLLGAMTIVELIDVHGGFNLITNKITTKNKRKLLWLLVFVSFFLSAVIDNLTTAIVMVALLRKIIPDRIERWWFASIIIIACNSGGAWSPIGDVTTILLWVKGTVTPDKLMVYVFLPSLMSVLVPLLIITPTLKGKLKEATETIHQEKKKPKSNVHRIDERRKLIILIMGILGLLLVPIYKNITELPPFSGVLLALGILWIITDIMYRKVPDTIPFHLRVATVIKRIDLPTLLFFLGILMAVAALQASGGLVDLSNFLERNFKDIYLINIIIGILSAIIDNVPLVAAAIGLYPLVDPTTLSMLADPTFMANFVPNGIYWHFLTYCAGVGGSILIIGSAAGVVVMGMEKISFVWYLKRISWLAFIGYIAGAITFMLEVWLIQGHL